MKPVQEIFPLLTAPRKVVITTHQKPDPDAMGSSLGMYHFLISMGHEVSVISPTNWATWLNWMQSSNVVIDYELSQEKAHDALNKADWLFCLDFNIFTRTKNLSQKLYDFKGTRVLIDHHQQPDIANFDYGISDTAKSSTAEMVYDFIVQSGHSDKINTPSPNAYMQELWPTQARSGLHQHLHLFTIWWPF